MTEFRTWRQAMQEALYGPAGFYTRGRGPGSDYRTSSTASPHFARALLRLAVEVDQSLGHPATFDLVEVGAAGGALLTAICDQVEAAAPGLVGRLRLQAVDLSPRPTGLAAEVGWSADIPPLTGLLFANEWLDNVPLDVVEVTEEGVRLVLVGPDGTESLGPPPDVESLAWFDEWWPLEGAEIGDRAEIGLPRDVAWRKAASKVERGVAVAVDYAHVRAERVGGGFAAGTLVGYRDGRLVAAAPDGSMDITAHVALDSCAAAADSLAATSSIVDQRGVLRALGVTGSLPSRELASTDPVGYLAALQSATEEAELIRADGLGAFRWLSHAIGCGLPTCLTPENASGVVLPKEDHPRG